MPQFDVFFQSPSLDYTITDLRRSNDELPPIFCRRRSVGNGAEMREQSFFVGFRIIVFFDQTLEPTLNHVESEVAVLNRTSKILITALYGTRLL